MTHRAAAFLATLITVLVVGSAPAQDEPDEQSWPREYPLSEGGKLVVYQPQIERWDDFEQLQALVAVSLAREGEDETLGGLRILADTDTDQITRKVVLRNITVAETSFPMLDEAAAAAATEQVVKVFPKGPSTVSLDGMLANMNRDLVKIRDVPVNNDPPQIYLSYKNATMAILDGDPVYQRVPGTEVFMVVNTPSYLFRHGRFEQYYMVYGRSWVTSDHLTRSWEPDNSLPDTFTDMPTEPKWQGVRSRVPGKLMSFGEMPDVFVVQPSAEIFQFNREPRPETIPGTSLEYFTNSNNDVFRAKQDGQYYLLISGRWFRAPGIDSPLQFCTDTLPADFAKIPLDHPCARVLPCVPGTPEAKEAVIAAHVPRAVKVKRDGVTHEATFIGPPAFTPIEGTGVEYAVNTSLDVFRVAGGYFACHDAIWYQASAPQGPYAVCDSVPQAIYSIPPSSPKFHVTYAFVDESTAAEVVFIYYPGYRHTFVAGDTVVFGTGYRYEMPKEYYIHFFQNPRLHLNNHLGHLQTYGYGYFYDHLAGGFQISPATRTHHISSTSSAGPYLAWANAAMAAVPYGATGAAMPSREDGTVVRGRPDYYAGPDGNVYQRDNMSWRVYQSGRRWGESRWDGNLEASQLPSRVRVEPGSWTRRPATQRGLRNHSFSRGITANKYQFFRMNYYGNRTQ